MNRIGFSVLLIVAITTISFAQQQTKEPTQQPTAVSSTDATKNGAVEAKPTKPSSRKYTAIEVVKFNTQEGVNFPPDYRVTLVEDMVKELQMTQIFKQVLREGEKADTADAKVLRVAGTVTEFNPGSRAARYLVGFGAGKTKLVAKVKFIDPETGEAVWEDKMDGRVWIGMFGGESIGASRGLAKEIAKKTKEHFFKN